MMLKNHVIKNAVLIIIGILAGLFLIAFFIISFFNAERDVAITSVNMTQAQCDGKCQALLALGFNYVTCDEFFNNPDVIEYKDQCVSYNSCSVTIKDSVVCVIK